MPEISAIPLHSANTPAGHFPSAFIPAALDSPSNVGQEHRYHRNKAYCAAFEQAHPTTMLTGMPSSNAPSANAALLLGDCRPA